VALNVSGVSENYTDGSSEDAPLIPQTHLKKEKNEKKKIITFRCRTVGRLAYRTLYSGIFLNVGTRCVHRAIENIVVNFSSGENVFSIIFYLLIFFEKLEEIGGIVDQRLTNVPCRPSCISRRGRLPAISTLREFCTTGFRYAISETQMQ